jgi:hypothetical protein
MTTKSKTADQKPGHVAATVSNATVTLEKESGRGGFYSLRVNGRHIWRMDETQADVARTNLLLAKSDGAVS